jgi:carlactone synthase/all-trans-10'-apo-beta-carotenal 13,14-cleaving dioxygenase
VREFATAPPTSGPLAAALATARDVLAIVTGANSFTDNASVSLHAVGPGRGKLLAVSETPTASYLVDPASLATLEKVGRGGRGQGPLPPEHRASGLRGRRAQRSSPAAALGGHLSARNLITPTPPSLFNRPCPPTRPRATLFVAALDSPLPCRPHHPHSQAVFPDKVKGDLTTAHPTVLSDGRLLNFTRSLPFGGFHIFKQASGAVGGGQAVLCGSGP